MMWNQEVDEGEGVGYLGSFFWLKNLEELLCGVEYFRVGWLNIDQIFLFEDEDV